MAKGGNAGSLLIPSAKASHVPLTQNATLAMMLQTNCSDVPGTNDLINGGLEMDRTTGSGLNATSQEIANQIRRSLALGNSLLSTNNLAEAGSTRGKSANIERKQHNTVSKYRSYSAARLGSRPGNFSQTANRIRPELERLGQHFGYAEGAYPIANNYSTIIPRKRPLGANLQDNSQPMGRYGTLTYDNQQIHRSGTFRTLDRPHDAQAARGAQVHRENLFQRQTNNYMSEIERNLSPDYDITTLAVTGDPMADRADNTE